MKRRTRRPYFTPRKRANVLICELALVLLALLIALGGIKGEHLKTVKAQTILSSTFVSAANIPTPTPTPTATPEPAKIQPGDVQGLKGWTEKEFKEIASLIKKYFPEDPATALAIFKSESGFNTKGASWNCHFTDYPWNGGHVIPEKTPTSKSWICPHGYQHLSWSVDCGLVQNNFPGLRECPVEAFDPEWSLQTARPKYDWRRSLGLTGWEAWTDYRNGKYKNNLDWAREVLQGL
jgi:hypothetical protein